MRRAWVTLEGSPSLDGSRLQHSTYLSKYSTDLLIPIPQISIESVCSCINSSTFLQLCHPPNLYVSPKILQILRVPLPRATMGSSLVLSYWAPPGAQVCSSFGLPGLCQHVLGNWARSLWGTQDSSFILSSGGYQSPNHISFISWLPLEWIYPFLLLYTVALTFLPMLAIWLLSFFPSLTST